MLVDSLLTWIYDFVAQFDRAIVNYDVRTDGDFPGWFSSYGTWNARDLFMLNCATKTLHKICCLNHYSRVKEKLAK